MPLGGSFLLFLRVLPLPLFISHQVSSDKTQYNSYILFLPLVYLLRQKKICGSSDTSVSTLLSSSMAKELPNWIFRVQDIKCMTSLLGVIKHPFKVPLLLIPIFLGSTDPANPGCSTHLHTAFQLLSSSLSRWTDVQTE